MQRCGLQKRSRPRDDGFSFRRENSSGRPQKISKWKLEELREGETYSLLAAPGALAPQTLLPDIDIEYFNNVHLSVPSSPSDHGDGTNIAAPRSTSRALSRSHTELRSLLRRGIRLKEEDFEVVGILRKKVEPDAAVPAGGDQTGGSGEISHVRLKENPNVHCVMKTFFLHLSEENLQDYEQQFTCLYGHQHPNIVPIYDVCFKRVNLVGGWKFFSLHASCRSRVVGLSYHPLASLPLPDARRTCSAGARGPSLLAQRRPPLPSRCETFQHPHPQRWEGHAPGFR
mmetsp:Transcript_9586/g.32109  ORF Transcript_9586/g.32109 Transcript_9586/m.32109 type:complete len:285 (-) Transcript_9586:753-1607(-)